MAVTIMDYDKLTQQDLVRIHDLAMDDPAALRNWTLVVNHIVAAPADVLRINTLITKDLDFPSGILQSLQIWYGYGSKREDLLQVLGDRGLNDLAGKIQKKFQFQCLDSNQSPHHDHGPVSGSGPGNDQVKTVYERLIAEYKSQFEAAMAHAQAPNEFMDDDAIEVLHTRLKKRALEKYASSSMQGSFKMVIQYQELLITSLETIFLECKTMNADRRNAQLTSGKVPVPQATLEPSVTVASAVGVLVKEMFKRIISAKGQGQNPATKQPTVITEDLAPTTVPAFPGGDDIAIEPYDLPSSGKTEYAEPEQTLVVVDPDPIILSEPEQSYSHSLHINNNNGPEPETEPKDFLNRSARIIGGTEILDSVKVSSLFNEYMKKLDDFLEQETKKTSKNSGERLVQICIEFERECHKLISVLRSQKQIDRVNEKLNSMKVDLGISVDSDIANVLASNRGPRPPSSGSANEVKAGTTPNQSIVRKPAPPPPPPLPSATSQNRQQSKPCAASSALSTPTTNSFFVLQPKNSDRHEQMGPTFVTHLGRSSTVTFTLVRNCPEANQKFIKIPASIAFLDEEYVVGKAAQDAPGAIHLHTVDARAGSYSMRVKGKIVKMRYEQILALFLAKCKQMVKNGEEQVLATTIVIVIPVMTSSFARMAMQDSALLAGFKVVRLISEPAAVAFEYFQKTVPDSRQDKPDETILVVYYAANRSADFALFTRSSSGHVQMVTVSGPEFQLPKSWTWTLPQGLASMDTSTLSQRHVRDLKEQAGLTSHSEISRIVMATDSHPLVELRDGDLKKPQYYNAGNMEYQQRAVMDGVTALAFMALSSDWNNLIGECAPSEVKLKCGDGTSCPNSVIILKRNERLPQTIERSFLLDGKTKSALFELYNSSLREFLPMIGYRLTPETVGQDKGEKDNVITCVFSYDWNGIPHVFAYVLENAHQFRPVKVERTDSLNMSSEFRAVCEKFMAENLEKYVRKQTQTPTKYVVQVVKTKTLDSEEEKAKIREVKAELSDYVHHLREALSILKNSGARSKARVQELEVEISVATGMVKDENCNDLHALRSQLSYVLALISNN